LTRNDCRSDEQAAEPARVPASLPEHPATQPEHQGQNQTPTPGAPVRDRVEQLMARSMPASWRCLPVLLLPIVIYSIIAAYGAYREGRAQSIEPCASSASWPRARTNP